MVVSKRKNSTSNKKNVPPPATPRRVSQRKTKPRQFYYNEDEVQRGVLEWTTDSQCGLNQPGGDGRKLSKYEALGDKVWTYILKPAGWCYRRYYNDLANSYIYYIGPPKSKAIVDGLEEGFTKFTGLERLGRQYEKDGKNDWKIIERAEESLAVALNSQSQDIRSARGPSEAPRSVDAAFAAPLVSAGHPPCIVPPAASPIANNQSEGGHFARASSEAPTVAAAATTQHAVTAGQYQRLAAPAASVATENRFAIWFPEAPAFAAAAFRRVDSPSTNQQNDHHPKKTINSRIEVMEKNCGLEIVTDTWMARLTNLEKTLMGTERPASHGLPKRVEILERFIEDNDL